MRMCTECPYTKPKLGNCQACYIAEKSRRGRLEQKLVQLLYEIDKFMFEVKKI